MQSFFMKKFTPHFEEGEDTPCFILKSLVISKRSSLTFVIQTMTFQAKLPSHYF